MVPPKNYHANALALHDYIKSFPQSQFQNNPKALLDAIEQYVDTIQSLMTYQQRKLDVTEKALSKLNPAPKVLMELGGYVGASAVAWGPMLQRLQKAQGGDGNDVKVFSLELEADFVKIIRDFIETAGLSDITEAVQGESATSLRKLKSEKRVENIDVLFLDHWERFYVPDVRLCEELGLLKKGTVIVADNTDHPGAPDYLKYMESGGEGGWKYRCETVDLGHEDGGTDIVHFAYVEETP